MKRRNSVRLFSAMIIGGVLLWFAWGFGATRSVEEPRYEVLGVHAGYEIRSYEGYIVAQITMQGTRVTAMRDGQRVLSQYLAGDNALQESFAMRRPVGVEPGPSSERIALIAPFVTQERGDSFLVSTIVPASYTIVTVPRPNNPEIRILKIPPAVIAVRTWYGSVSDARVDEEERILRELLAQDKRVILSALRVTQYSPSWTPWLIRRNEVAIPIRAQ